MVIGVKVKISGELFEIVDQPRIRTLGDFGGLWRLKNGIEIGNSEEGMWAKQDLWILEQAIYIYSGKVIISAYLCSGKDRALSIQKAE